MRSIICLLILITFVGYSGCQDDLSDCFKNNGTAAVEEFEVAPFTAIYAYDGLQVHIKQGDDYRVTIQSGSNTISGVNVSSDQGILTIRDDVACEWSRQYETKEVIVQCPDLRAIYQQGYGSIQSAGPLALDSLLVEARIGNGDISLEVNTGYLHVQSSRNGTITMKGNTDFLNVEYLSNNAIFEGRNLYAGQIKIFHKSNNSFHLYPLYSLRGKLLKKGSAFLYHHLEDIRVEVTGKGKIVDLSAGDP